MIGLDTNILVRYFLQDDFEQASLATDLLENRLTKSNQGFLSTVTILELNWVLQSVYSLDSRKIAQIILKLLSVQNLVVESASAVRTALKDEEQSFSNALIHAIGIENGCEYTVTFDRKFARHEGVRLLTHE
jgi:predicted nucleic-acid-binding protein